MRRRRCLLIAPLVVGLAACGAQVTESTSTPPPHTAFVPFTQSARTQIAAMDAAWKLHGAAICAAVPSQPLSHELEEEMVAAYEDGFGHPLLPAARQHLLDLIGDCP